MEGVALITGRDLKAITDRIANIEQMQKETIQMMQQMMLNTSTSNFPDFISVGDAAKKYKTTRQTIYTKMRLFESHMGKPIDRADVCGQNFIKERELFKAMQLK